MNVLSPKPVEFAKALADGTRQKIMELCCCEWRSVTELTNEMHGEVSQPTISHHLSILKSAGLVDSRRDGKQVFYTLNQQKVTRCCGELMQVFAPDFVSADAVGVQIEPS